ncbi:MAG TPA: 2-iminoacetate synthase ThiH [bacterium]|nr:2-iminoacetate synthase ThiH [bacterium]
MSERTFHIDEERTLRLRDRALAATAADIAAVLGQEHLSPDELAPLLSPAMDDALFMRLAAESARLTRRRFGYALSLYIPLYYDNRCINRCRYCGFNAGNEVPRVFLSREEILREGRAIRRHGFTNLLLVAGEHPESADPSFLVPVIRDLHDIGFRSVSIEIAPLEEAAYRRLVTEAHLDGLYVYQETYHRATYAAEHPRGPKSDPDRRLATPERGARAGIAKIGIGFLLGLYDWRYETLALAQHLSFLQKHHWRAEFSISFPRIRKAEGVAGGPHPVGDREFLQMACALRLLFPETPMSLSTRESPAFRDAAVPIGFTNLSAGSSTVPGGYGTRKGALAQFEVEDARGPAEVAAALRARGFDPVWKDWE